MKNTNQNRSLVTTPIYCSLLRLAKMSCGAKNSQICVDELPFQFEASDRDFVSLTNGWVKFSGQQLIDAGLSARALVNMGYTHDMMIAAGFVEREKSAAAEPVVAAPEIVKAGEYTRATGPASYVYDYYIWNRGGELEAGYVYEAPMPNETPWNGVPYRCSAPAGANMMELFDGVSFPRPGHVNLYSHGIFVGARDTITGYSSF